MADHPARAPALSRSAATARSQNPRTASASARTLRDRFEPTQHTTPKGGTSPRHLSRRRPHRFL